MPQAYLRGFAADGERRSKIWRFSKTQGEPELKPIEKVAVKFHLYAPRDENGRRDDSFETQLADLECWFGNPVWRALQSDMVDLSWEPLRKMVALLAAIMFLRNPTHLHRTAAVHRKLVDFYDGLPELPESFEHKGKVYPLDTESWPAFRNAGEDDLKRMWIAEMKGAASYAKALMAMRWSVLFSEDPVFVTSDNPITNRPSNAQVPLHQQPGYEHHLPAQPDAPAEPGSPS